MIGHKQYFVDNVFLSCAIISPGTPECGKLALSQSFAKRGIVLMNIYIVLKTLTSTFMIGAKLSGSFCL